MATNVLLLHYNNYFNRIVKKLDTIGEYKTADTNYSICNGVNFVPGDGINTSLVLGFGNNPSNVFDNGANFDYLVVSDSTAPNYNILSRWFIIETNRTRDGQYEMRLRRDLIADNYDDVINSPMYIEKGYISNLNDPLLYNKESLQVNQIKELEVPIKDKTECGWVVGYIPRDSFEQDTTVTSSAVFAQTPDITVQNLSDWTYWNNCELNPNYKSIAEVKSKKEIAWKVKSIYQNNAQLFYACKNVYSYVGKDEGWALSAGQSGSGSVGSTLPIWYTDFSGIEWKDTYAESGSTTGNIAFGNTQCQLACVNLLANGTLNGYLNTFISNKINVEFNNTKWDYLSNLENKVIYDSTNNLYYRIKINTKSDTTRFAVSTADTGGSNIINFINNNLVRTNLNTYGTLLGNLRSNDVYQVQLTESSKYISLEQVSVEVVSTITNAAARTHLEDSPYDMFCIPYSDTIQMTDGTDTWTCNKAVAVSIATDIGAKSGSNNLYDIQILPYCPSQQLVTESIDPANLLNIASVPHNLITTTDATPRKISAIIWCPKSTFSIDVENTTDGATYTGPFETISEFRRNIMYVATEIQDLHPASSAASITYPAPTYYNGFALYKIDKSTNKAEYERDVRLFRVSRENNVITFTIGIGNNGQAETYKVFTQAEYAALDYMYAFIWFGSNTITGYNESDLYNDFKLPTINYYGIDLSTPEKAKIDNDCKLYRLSAGNYSAVFEFSPAKSQGFSGFNIDCTYKPYSPWIHVVPKLKGLYGNSFVELDDARGLICGGDYSLPQVTNAWANYQLTNKTYQDVFDRQIANMDVNNSIARQEQMFQSVAGSLTGGTTGAVAGALSGAKAGPYGAIAGAVVGGVAGTALGAVGGTMDYNNLVARQEEAKSYATDLFNYNLQNIQAIPTALAKTSALVANTRIWPFLEVFECTDREKQAYLDKLTYNGMTVMAIGKLNDYIVNEPHFFKGEIIRLPTLKEDAHMANEICAELKKGVYL